MRLVVVTLLLLACGCGESEPWRDGYSAGARGLDARLNPYQDRPTATQQVWSREWYAGYAAGVERE